MTPQRSQIGAGVSKIPHPSFPEGRASSDRPVAVNTRRPGHRASDVLVGLVVGAITVVLSVSFGALIFGGAAPESVSVGVGMALFTAFAAGVVVSAGSSWPTSIAIPQDRTAPILALIAAFVAGALPAETGSDERLATILAAVALATFATGACLTALGVLRLGVVIRFIPYPVIGGFLGGSGWLLVIGAIRVMSGAGTVSPLELVRPDALLVWVPGAVLGVGILLSGRGSPRPLLMPALLAGAAALFYACLWFADVPAAEARARGWLLEPLSADSLWSPALWSAFDRVHWSAILPQAGLFGAIVLVSVVSILLNASALELAAEEEIDLNRELQAAGGANLLAGFAGGMVGFHSLSLSSLALRMGGRSRLVGFVSAAVCGITLLAGTELLAYVPKLVLGGLLLSLGLSFLVDWLYDGWFRLTPSDYLVTVLIVAVVGAVGYLEGVAVGIVAAAVLFAVNYSRINVVKYALSGANHQSNVDRPIQHHRVLRERGEQIHILKLQGFIFFGTAYNLLVRVRDRAESASLPRLRFVVLDFRQVTGLDSSAALNFVKLERLAAQNSFVLVLTHRSDAVRGQMRQQGFEGEEDALVREFPDLDHGLEWCENRILSGERDEVVLAGQSLSEQLSTLLGEGTDPERVLGHLARSDLPGGVTLIAQGAPSDELYFIESGRVTVRLRLQDGRSLRLRSMGSGTVVGEMGLYLGQPRSAAVVTEENCVVYGLTAQALTRMERNDPAAAAAFHRFMACLLAERLANTNQTLRAVLD